MNSREVFDTVRQHLMAQGAQSVGDYSGTEVCLYRNRDGLMCAVGVLIPDSEYRASFENVSASSLDIFDLYNEELISELQRIHDSVQVENWEDRLARMAKEYGY